MLEQDCDIEQSLLLNSLPVFRAETVETDSYPKGLLKVGDFIFTPRIETKKGLRIGNSFEIWERDDGTDDGYYQINPQTLEISIDGGKTFQNYMQIKSKINEEA